MRTPLSTSALSVPLGECPTLAPNPVLMTLNAPQRSLVLPEPPSLGCLPRSSRLRVWAYSLTLFGGCLSGGVVLSLAPPAVAAPVRSVALALEDFDLQVAPAAPPPAAPAAVAAQTPPSAQPEPSEPLRMPEPTPSTAIQPSSSGSPVLGQVGGVPGGLAGGVAGGLLGGQAGAGNASEAIAPPSFDAAYLQNPEPAYPSLSKRLGEEGRVILRVLVNAEGQPEQVELRQSSGHSRLDQAALGTVRRWRFSPACRGAERLAAWVLVPLRFQLDA